MAKSEKKNKKKWVKPRHKFFTWLGGVLVLMPMAKIRFGIKVDRSYKLDQKQYLILYNHQTPFDQFFVGMLFRRTVGAVYYVATEDIFSLGFLSSLLRYSVAPIPIKKSVADVRAVMNCLKVAKEGGTIAIAPEGNRTYSGKTANIKRSITGLVKAVKMPVAFVKIEGGYGAEPRWSDTTRKGPVRVYVDKVMSAEEVKALPDDELYEVIKNGLYADERTVPYEYLGKKKAEYMERLFYVCPVCKQIVRFESHGDRCKCLNCGTEFEYTSTKKIVPVSGEFPFDNVADWYDYQEDFINGFDLSPYIDNELFADAVRLDEVIVYKHKKKLFKKAEFKAYADRYEIIAGEEKFVYTYNDITAVTVCGRNKLQFYHGERIYQVKGDKRFNAVKYMHVYFRAKNSEEGNNVKFLGL